jgi:hypothetical protein
VAVSDGNATCSFTLPATSCNLIGAAVGTVSLTASYSGDSINVPAMASATHIVVGYGDTLSIGSVTGPDGLYGATTFTVTLAAASGAATDPTGTILVMDGDGIHSCSITLPDTSCNVYYYSDRNVGTATAYYAGDANFAAALAGPVPYQFLINSRLNLQINPEPSTLGQPYTIQALVTGQYDSTPEIPTGTVTISDGAHSCTLTLPNTCSLAGTTAGAVGLTVNYSGDANYTPAQSTVSHDILFRTATSITQIAPEPSALGQPYTVSANVVPTASGASTSPTGSIAITDGTQTCTIQLPALSCSLAGGNATSTASLTASYSGDSSFAASTSASVSHQIAPAGPMIGNLDPRSGTVGTQVKINGSGFDATNAASDTVSFNGTPATVTYISPVLLIVTVPQGATSGPVTATVDGQTSNAQNFQVVTPGAGAVTVTITSVTPEPGIVNQTYTVNVTVAATSSLAPTGTLYVGSQTSACFIDLPATSCTMPGEPTVGEVTIVAAYSGDTNYQIAVSNSQYHVTNPAQPTEMCALDPWATPNDPPGFVPVDQLSGIVYTPGIENDITGTGNLSVSITSLATTSNSTADIVGTFVGPTNTGIVVNGVVAYTANGYFLAPHVGLKAGVNAISVTATTLPGEKTTATSTIIQTATSSPITFTANKVSVFLGATTNFNVAVGALPNNVGIRSISIDFDGDGIYDTTAPTPSALYTNFQYSRPGLYNATLLVTDIGGSNYFAYQPVLIQDPVAQRYMLCDIYAYLKGRFLAQDAIGAAMAYQPPAQAQYQSLFTALGANMPSDAALLGNIVSGSIGKGFAEMTLVRDNADQTRSGFPLRITQATDGVWRISEM